jgi:hypothetical protein
VCMCVVPGVVSGRLDRFTMASLFHASDLCSPLSHISPVSTAIVRLRCPCGRFLVAPGAAAVSEHHGRFGSNVTMRPSTAPVRPRSAPDASPASPEPPALRFPLPVIVAEVRSLGPILLLSRILIVHPRPRPMGRWGLSLIILIMVNEPFCAWRCSFRAELSWPLPFR